MNSLLSRMILSFSGLIFVAGVVLGITLYESSTSLVENSMGLQAKAVAEKAVQRIDIDAYSQIKPATGGETEYYTKLREELNAIRETNGFKYLYTLAKVDQDGKSSYVYVVDGAPKDAKEDDFSALGTSEDNAYPGMVTSFEEGQPTIGELTKDEYGATVTAYVPFKGKDGKLLGVMGADLDATAVYKLMDHSRKTMIAIAAGIFAVSVLLVVVLARILTRPLSQLTQQVAKVGEGDMTVAISMNRKDEIGRLASAFGHLVADTRKVIQGIKGSSEQLLSAAGGVADHARQTTQASHAISASIHDASQGAQMQVLRSSEVTKAMEEMTSGMQRIAESASVLAEVSQRTMKDANLGHDSIESAVTQMESIVTSSVRMAAATKHLEGRSGEIGEIVSVMAEIASQTNLLALNAAIEAARAGENGRGFAVVADEVRKLANQSQASSGRIAELIEAILEQTASLSASMEASAEEAQAGLGLVKGAGSAFGDILAGLERTTVQLQEVSAASEEVSAGSEEVAASVDEMERLSAQAAEHFREIAQASSTQLDSMDQVSGSAQSLRMMSEELKQLINRFKV
ncbi:methyl-accepting chemotaxis protein [Paenibacillus hexagrammi]|uniref:Methyl-accepting chemotaxis protein n=1 Tax=Paenibacillus hexagrammi TaxID=2908839 RepID=A0ABY3SEM7_9BACL|nr:methyl-accepting chemotaxis protein [Paenibacillus sp. YPD9-1]UJF31920.1 methyl-accepting chemotaxis protein [Paenibacillus sp. YPD9-1]